LVSSEYGATDVDDCMCESGGDSVPSWSAISYSIDSKTYKKLVIYVYQPGTYNINTTQYCNGFVSSTDNTSTDMIKIENGDNFNTYVNGMPLRFMLGNINGTANPNNKFYDPSGHLITDVKSQYMKGWYGVHQEDAYIFEDTSQEKESIWDDFMTITSDIKTSDMKKKILEFKFKNMFSLANGVYVTNDTSHTIRYTHTGGSGLILERCLIPSYKDEEKLFKGVYIYDDYNASTCPPQYPNIVGGNYGKAFNEPYTSGDIKFNKNIGGGNNNNINRQGSYFASFTNNGGYISEKVIDTENTIVVKLPYEASVNAYTDDNKIKRLGLKDENARIGSMEKAYSGQTDITIPYLPYLRCMYVDRRLDYDFTVFGSCVEEDLDSTKYGTNESWKWIRIFGKTYGGIEMSYDEDYNIISADTVFDNNTHVSVSATPNNALEYSYYFKEEDSNTYTKYNSGTTITKRFYESTLNDIDIRCNSSNAAVIDKSGANVISYHDNSDFNMDAVCSALDNYPTRNILDVSKISGTTSLIYNTISCSYNMKPRMDSNGVISCRTTRGERTKFTLSFSNPIQLISSLSGDVIYATDDGRGDASRGFTMIVSEKDAKTNFSFIYNIKSSSDFDSYIKPPKIIKVLDTVDPTVNQISNSHYKEKNNEDEIISAISSITLINYGDEHWRDITSVPEGVDIINGFYAMDGQYLSSTDSDFKKIIFKSDGDSIVARAFAILTERCYFDNYNSYLMKKIHSYELSKVYEIASGDVTVVIDGDNSGRTYVTETTSEDDPEKKTYLQHIGFDITSPMIENDIIVGYSFTFNRFVTNSDGWDMSLTVNEESDDLDDELVMKVAKNGETAHIDLTLKYNNCLALLNGDGYPNGYVSWDYEQIWGAYYPRMSILLITESGFSYKIQKTYDTMQKLDAIWNDPFVTVSDNVRKCKTHVEFHNG